jgi:hypothetical protein
MGRGYVIVEGQGEVDAILNLLTRLWQELGLPYAHWAQPMRRRGLHIEQRAREACRLVRARGDADMLLLLRDADLDEDCPRERGPATAAWMRAETLPFPTAVVLFHKEYETLFLPCLPRMAGRTWQDERGNERGGFLSGTVYPGDPEHKRGVKEWLSEQLPPGRSYKPTLDQLPLTRMLDFGALRAARLPCFGTLERALRFLGTHTGQVGAVYPGHDVPGGSP